MSSSPSVCIDFGLALVPPITGISFYGINLREGLRELAEVQSCEYTELLGLPRLLRRAGYLLRSNAAAAGVRTDILHYIQTYTPFMRSPATKVATIHDISSYLHPYTKSRDYIEYDRQCILGALKKCRGIIVPSQSVRYELLNQFPHVEEDRVHVCYNAVHDAMIEADPDAGDTFRYKNTRYFLFVGTLERRKNIAMLVRTFVRAQRTGTLPDDIKLILVGKPGFRVEEIMAEIPDDGSVILPGYVPNEEMPLYYRYALAFVYPSVYEGFGIPIIEAMHANVPIICSDIPTNIELNERHNSQMRVFELEREEDLIAALCEYAEDAESLRAGLSYTDAHIYTPQNFASWHLEAYKRILS